MAIPRDLWWAVWKIRGITMAQQFDHQADADVQALKITLDRLLHNVGMLLGVPSASVALLDADTLPAE
jgi:hypothetical protein